MSRVRKEAISSDAAGPRAGASLVSVLAQVTVHEVYDGVQLVRCFLGEFFQLCAELVEAAVGFETMLALLFEAFRDAPHSVYDPLQDRCDARKTMFVVRVVVRLHVFPLTSRRGAPADDDPRGQ